MPHSQRKPSLLELSPKSRLHSRGKRWRFVRSGKCQFSQTTIRSSLARRRSQRFGHTSARRPQASTRGRARQACALRCPLKFASHQHVNVERSTAEQCPDSRDRYDRALSGDCSTNHVTMWISDVSVRWTGHCSAISIRRCRWSVESGPSKSSARSIRSRRRASVSP